MKNIDILKIGQEASKNKEKDPSVVNATVGMFYDDNKNLIINQVLESYHQVANQELFKYGPTSGGIQFEKNVLKWVFKGTLDNLEKRFKLKVCATPGGSGALSLAFDNYSFKSSTVLTSNIRWRYDYFTQAAGLKIVEHNLFSNDQFDIKDFKSKVNKILKNENHLTVVINDPCQNPSGYTLSLDELNQVFSILNQHQDKKITLVYDIAYLDYDSTINNQEREKFNLFINLKKHITPLIVFSASKSLSIYGFRLGALIALLNNQKEVDFFETKVIDNALGKWSTTPSVGIAIFNHLSQKDQKEQLVNQFRVFRETLKKRSEIFIKEANKINLPVYPYKDGFYCLIKSIDPLKDYNKLIEKEKIYLVPTKLGLRLALCSLTSEEIVNLAQRIKKTIQN